MRPRRRGLVLIAFWLASAIGRVDTAGAQGLIYLVHAPSVPAAHPPLLVLLHGSGADERDMITLWRQLPGLFVVVSPRAPFPDKGGGYRWYRKGTAAAQAADIALSRKIVDVMIDNAVSRFEIDPRKVFIGGFSQGAVMVYDLALHEPTRFRGAAVLSGTLFGSSRAGVTSATGWGQDELFIAHGTADRRIPLASATSAPAGADGVSRICRHGPRDRRSGDRRSPPMACGPPRRAKALTPARRPARVRRVSRPSAAARAAA